MAKGVVGRWIEWLSWYVPLPHSSTPEQLYIEQHSDISTINRQYISYIHSHLTRRIAGLYLCYICHRVLYNISSILSSHWCIPWRRHLQLYNETQNLQNTPELRKPLIYMGLLIYVTNIFIVPNNPGIEASGSWLSNHNPAILPSVVREHQRKELRSR